MRRQAYENRSVRHSDSTDLAGMLTRQLYDQMRTGGIETQGLAVELDLGGGIRAVLRLGDGAWVCTTVIGAGGGGVVIEVIFECCENQNQYQEEFEFEDAATDTETEEAYKEWVWDQIGDRFGWYRKLQR
ncbi:MAG: hypothetical protein M0P69_14945 [Bacteroidales bacterium]|nr:hypothetical protein [Bacteroidales bacterium]